MKVQGFGYGVQSNNPGMVVRNYACGLCGMQLNFEDPAGEIGKPD